MSKTHTVFNTGAYLLPVLYLYLFMLPTQVAGAGDAHNSIPLPVKVALHKAQQLMAEKQYIEAIKHLKHFRSKGEQHEKSSPAGLKGHRHHLIDFTLGNGYLIFRHGRFIRYRYPGWRPKRCYSHRRGGTGPSPLLWSRFD